MKYTASPVLLFVFFLTILLIPCHSQAADTIQGKNVSCRNSDLAGNNSGDASFNFFGTFKSQTTMKGSFNLDMEKRGICDAIGTVEFNAAYNSSTGQWAAENLTFQVSTDGYLNNFVYSKSSGYVGTCRITMTGLKLTGSAMPWMNLLLKGHSDEV